MFKFEPQMKRVLSILFLLVFTYNMAGFFVVFKLQQLTAKDEMKAFIKNNHANTDLEKIIVPDSEISSGANDFRYLDDNKEFSYQGKLYDIFRTASDGCNTVFYCVNDKNEELILAKYKEQLQRNNDQNVPCRSQTGKLVKIMIKDYLPHYVPVLAALSASTISFNTSPFKVINQVTAVFTPPPEA
jgi:hypothetical protein